MDIRKRISQLLSDEEGATAVEYALIVTGIAAAIIVVVYFLGNKTNNTIGGVAARMP